MENLASFGVFLGGVGLLSLSSGISRYHTQIRPTAQVHYIAGG